MRTDLDIIATFKAYYLRNTFRQLIEQTDRQNRQSL